MVKKERIDAMKVKGNALCLDYLNTIAHRFKDPVESYVQDTGDLLYWGKEKVGILADEQYVLMATHAAGHPEEAAAFFLEAMDLRTLLDSIFYPISQKQSPTRDGMAAFNATLRTYRAHEAISPSGPGYEVSYDWAPVDFHRLTAPIIASAVELLTSSSLERVGACPRCGWVYLDLCKNGKRRWCSMDDCGSAAKAKEYYHRRKAAAP